MPRDIIVRRRRAEALGYHYEARLRGLGYSFMILRSLAIFNSSCVGLCPAGHKPTHNNDKVPCCCRLKLASERPKRAKLPATLLFELIGTYMNSSWLTRRRHSALISTGVPSLSRKSISMRLNTFD